MTRILSLFGLMRVSEHERSVRALESQLVLRENAFEAIEGERDRLSDKFKQAVADLEKQAVKIEVLEDAILQAEAQADALRPDAEAMRKKRAADRKRMAGKRNG